jgi:hypothetical protein
VKFGIEHQRATCLRSHGRRHVQLEHETVASRGGELEGFLLLDPVAVGEHDHVWKPMLAIECRDGALGHRPQQQGLNLRAGAVDLVEEECRQLLAVPEQGAGLNARPAFGVHVGVIDEIAGHQIDSALDALEISTDRSGERAQNGRLADADIAFEQHVPAGEQRHVDQSDRLALAYDSLAYLVLDTQRPIAPILQLFVECHQTLVGETATPRRS